MSKYYFKTKFLAGCILAFFGVLCVVPSALAEGAKYPSYAFKADKVVILPFADYSHQTSFEDATKWGGNRRVVEYIKNEFEARKIEVAPQDQVIEALLKSGAIKTLKYVDDFGTPEYELIHAPHWDMMTKELFKKIEAKQEPTNPIAKQQVIELGKAFGADVIVRGAILHYELKPKLVENTFEDLIPFLMIDKDKPLYAYAIGPEYEKDIYDQFRITSLHNYGLMFPLNEKSSGIIVAIFIQDAKTGKIMVKDAVEVPYPDANFNATLSKAISGAFNKLFRLNNYGYLYVK